MPIVVVETIRLSLVNSSNDGLVAGSPDVSTKFSSAATLVALASALACGAITPLPTADTNGWTLKNCVDSKFAIVIFIFRVRRCDSPAHNAMNLDREPPCPPSPLALSVFFASVKANGLDDYVATAL